MVTRRGRTARAGEGSCRRARPRPGPAAEDARDVVCHKLEFIKRPTGNVYAAASAAVAAAAADVSATDTAAAAVKHPRPESGIMARHRRYRF